jgi:hypothetical protein
MEEWAAICRHVKALDEQEYMSREHEMDSATERVIFNADDDTSESSIGCIDNDIQGVCPIFGDSE